MARPTKRLGREHLTREQRVILDRYLATRARIAADTAASHADRALLARDLPASGYTIRETADLLGLSVERVLQLRR